MEKPLTCELSWTLALLGLTFWQEVLYLSYDKPFPDTTERLGSFSGVLENVGDTITFYILTEKNKIMSRSLVHPCRGLRVSNKHDRDETTESKEILYQLQRLFQSPNFLEWTHLKLFRSLVYNYKGLPIKAAVKKLLDYGT